MYDLCYLSPYLHSRAQRWPLLVKPGWFGFGSEFGQSRVPAAALHFMQEINVDLFFYLVYVVVGAY